MSDETELQQMIIDWHTTFDSESGKRVLDRLSKFCLEKQSCYTQGDSHETAFNEGARSVILEIRRRLELNPNKPIQSDVIS